MYLEALIDFAKENIMLKFNGALTSHVIWHIYNFASFRELYITAFALTFI